MFGYGRRLFVTGLLSLVAVTLHAQSAPPSHDVTFDVQGQIYAGTTTFAVDKAGKVAGTMTLNTPVLVNATLNGEVKDGLWKFSYPFTMDNQGQACSGTVAGSAKVAAGLKLVEGDVTISGDCSPDPLSGTFRFKQKAG